MRGKRSSRGAAVVLAGCVGLALVAPGLAVAQDESCGTGLTMVDGICQTVTESLPSTQTPSTDSSESSTPDVPSTDTSSDSSSDSSPLPVDVPDVSDLPDLPVLPDLPDVPGATGSDSGSESADGAATEPSAARVAAADPAALVAGGDELQAQLDELLPGVTLPDLGGLTGNLPLPDGFVPELPEGGTFTNPQDACAFLAGTVTGPADATQARGLADAFVGFCGSLPEEFGVPGLGNLTDLLDALTGLLGGLVPTLPGGGAIGDGTIPSTPPSSTPVYFHGYWSHGYDVDCGDVSYDEAQALYALDRSDPFRLDGDDDGVACDRNSKATSNYDGYPKGGVSTGDGSTGASPAMVAVAATALSGLMLGGLTLVRRFGRES